MKMQRFIILPLLLLFAGLVHAQKDAVFLKDGSVIRGTLKEHLVGKSTTITTADGRERTFKHDLVKDVSIHGYKPSVTVKEKGYYNNTTIGLNFGASPYGDVFVDPSFLMVQGYQFNGQMQVGIGTGIEFLQVDGPSLPFFGEYTYFLRPEGFSPFVSAQAGYAMGLNRARSWRGEINPRAHGILSGIQFGIRNYGRQTVGWTLSLGYRYQQVNRTINEEFWTGGDFTTLKVRETAHTHRFGVRFGILFH
ncbi:MAG: hypothetical protein AAGN35_11335 [Bacteroidota bacterium]